MRQDAVIRKLEIIGEAVKRVTLDTRDRRPEIPSPDLKTELLNAIMGALDAHTAMSKQALNSPAVQSGIKDILLNHSRLWETLREQAAD